MCLLKPGQANLLCGHNECKSFYLLNKQCMYSQPTSTQTSLQRPTLAEIVKPNQISAFQVRSSTSNKTSPTTAEYSPMSLKRPVNSSSEVSLEDEAELVLNTKKVKTDGLSFKPDVRGLNIESLGQNTMLLNNSNLNLLSSAILPNKNYQINEKLSMNTLPQNLLNMNNIPQNTLLSILQNNQQSIQNIQLGYNNQNLIQMIPQNSFVQQEPLLLSQIATKEQKPANDSLEQVMRDFQLQTMALMSGQSKLIKDLTDKNDLVQDTLSCLIHEVTSLKNSFSTTKLPEKNSQNGVNHIPEGRINASLGDVITSNDLLNYLYKPETAFDYKIELSNPLSLPLYRERNFDFGVKLVDNAGNTVENDNKVPITISVYTCENPPKYVDTNTAGNKIFKGFVEKNMVKGSANFEKIQLKEVSSHFRNGWIFLVIHPKINSDDKNNVLIGKDGLVVDAKKVRPLILEKVIVKAKKTKEREDNIEVKTMAEM